MCVSRRVALGVTFAWQPFPFGCSTHPHLAPAISVSVSAVVLCVQADQGGVWRDGGRPRFDVTAFRRHPLKLGYAHEASGGQDNFVSEFVLPSNCKLAL